MTVFNHLDYWKAITLFGLNVATYKPALAKVLITAANEGIKEMINNVQLNFFHPLPIGTIGLTQQQTIIAVDLLVGF